MEHMDYDETSDSYTCRNGKNYRLHRYAAQSQKQAMPAKKAFINAANVKAALTKRTASKGITAKRQWKNATRFFLWQRNF